MCSICHRKAGKGCKEEVRILCQGIIEGEFTMLGTTLKSTEQIQSCLHRLTALPNCSSELQHPSVDRRGLGTSPLANYTPCVSTHDSHTFADVYLRTHVSIKQIVVYSRIRQEPISFFNDIPPRPGLASLSYLLWLPERPSPAPRIGEVIVCGCLPPILQVSSTTSPSTRVAYTVKGTPKSTASPK